jgi:U2 small nuclear ribonucleoprotein A'
LAHCEFVISFSFSDLKLSFVGKDAFDAVDLTDNSIRILGGFPVSQKLRTLLVSKNQISHIVPNLREQLPKLSTLIMAQNQIEDLTELSSLAGIPLTHLVLVGNKVAQHADYRLYLVHILPSLKMLDFAKVTVAVSLFSFLCYLCVHCRYSFHFFWNSMIFH